MSKIKQNLKWFIGGSPKLLIKKGVILFVSGIIIYAVMVFIPNHILAKAIMFFGFAQALAGTFLTFSFWFISLSVFKFIFISVKKLPKIPKKKIMETANNGF